MHRAIALSCFVVVAGLQPAAWGADSPPNATGQSTQSSSAAALLASKAAYAALQQSTNQAGSIQSNAALSGVMSSSASLATGQLSPALQSLRAPGQLQMQGNSVLAAGAVHSASFAQNLNTYGSIAVVMPDGQNLRSHPLAICYYIPNGPNILLANPKDCAVEIPDPNQTQVIYRDAFVFNDSGLKADAVYTYTKSSFDQSIVLRNQLPSPAAFGLDPDQTLVGVLTEFVEAPTPVKAFSPINLPMSSDMSVPPTLYDEMVFFPTMHLARSKSFLLGDGTQVPTGKSWQYIENRLILVESTPYRLLKASLDQLPPSGSSNAPATTLPGLGTPPSGGAMPQTPVPGMPASGSGSSGSLFLPGSGASPQAAAVARPSANLAQSNPSLAALVRRLPQPPARQAAAHPGPGAPPQASSAEGPISNNSSNQVSLGPVNPPLPPLALEASQESVGHNPALLAAVNGSTGRRSPSSTTPIASTPGVVLDYPLVNNATLNINFGGNDGDEVGPAAASDPGAGGNDFWNGYPYSDSEPLYDLSWSDGSSSSVYLTANNIQDLWSFSTSDTMFSTFNYFYPPDNSTPLAIAINNLPAGTYDFYCYGHDGNSSDNSQFQIVNGSFTSSLKATADSSDAASSDSWQENVQYVVIRSIGVASGDTVTLNVYAGDGGIAVLNGLQIVPVPPPVPVILAQPVNQSVPVGYTASFSVTAYGQAPLSYQWSHNGTAIPGATSATLLLPNVQNGNPNNANGTYTVMVSNGHGSVTSSGATLTVLGSGSALVNVDFGDASGNKVGAGAVGLSPADYWNGYYFPGSSSGTINGLKWSDGSASSINMTVANAPGVWGNSTGDPMYDSFVYPWNGASITVTLANIGPGTYDFYLYGHSQLDQDNTSFTISTQSGSKSTTASSQAATSADWVENLQYVVFRSVQISQGQTVTITAAKGNPNATAILNGMQILTTSAQSPAVLSGPASQTIIEGQDATMSVTVASAQPPSYQWRFNGNNIAGATSSSLILHNVQLTQGGSYDVKVTCGSANVTSSAATLTVNPAQVDPDPSGIIAWWPANGNALDIVGVNNGTLHGISAYAAGKVGQAFTLSSANGYMTAPDAAALRLSGAFTIEAWINPNTTNGDQAIVSKVGGASGNNGYQLVLSGNSLVGQFNTPGQAWPGYRVSVSGVIQPNVWTHVAWTYDQNALSLYTNGQLAATTTIGNHSIASGAATFRISGDDNNHVYFGGLIDETTVYSRALSASDISSIFNASVAGKADPCGYTYAANNSYGDGTYGPGFLMNLIINSANDPAGRLELNPQTKPFNYLNLPSGADGTLIRIDTASGNIVGEYKTAPTNKPSFPSHAVVDRYGNTWVANWDESGHLDLSQKGSVTCIGLVVGGTRGVVQKDGAGHVISFTPDPNGHYLKPPFTYCTAIDRDGDGYIKTSAGLNDVLGWSGSLTDEGNVTNADDECIINYVRVGARFASALALDANNDLWVGGYCIDSPADWPGYSAICGDKMHVKVDGNTLYGTQISGTAISLESSANGSVYGGFDAVIDHNGVLWSTGGANSPDSNRSLVTYLSPNAPSIVSGVSRFCTALQANGNVWISELDGNGVDKYDAVGHVSASPNNGERSGGLAFDNQGNLWVARGPWVDTAKVGYLDATPATPVWHTDVDLTALPAGVSCGSGFVITAPSTVAIDAAGKIWAICASHRYAPYNHDSPVIIRIDPSSTPPKADTCISFPGHGPREVYGDLTGHNLLAGNGSGFWSMIRDSGVPGQSWTNLTWHSSGDATQVRVEARSADQRSALGSQQFMRIPSSGAAASFTGQYLEIRVTLSKNGGATDPWLKDFTVQCGHTLSPLVVHAGAPQTVPWTTPTTTVAGIVTGGRQTPVSAWSKLSGPGSVNFSPDTTPANTLDAQVTFGAPGLYTLRLSASDSVTNAHDDLTVNVSANNQAPVVYAGGDQTITWPDMVYLPGAATDDGLPAGQPLQITWSNASPNVGTVTFDDPTSAATMASFSQPGTYKLQLAGYDGDKTTISNAFITVNAPSEYLVFHNTDVLSTGVGGMRDTGTGTIQVSGLSGTVTKAYLFWHGPTDSEDPQINSQVLVNRRLVTGVNVGTGSPDGYKGSNPEFANSQTYRADVTALVTTYGNSAYQLSGFFKGDEINVNGASLVVLFDDGSSSGKQDVVLWNGNESNGRYGFSVDGAVNAFALQADGKIIIGGDFTALNVDLASGDHRGIARLNPDGRTDNSFCVGTGFGNVSHLALQGNQVVVAGDFTDYNGIPRANLARLNSDGSLDESFVVDFGPSASADITAVLVDADSNIYITGSFGQIKGHDGNWYARKGIARLDLNGYLDLGFDPGAGFASGSVLAAALHQNKLLVGGDFDTYQTHTVPRIIRLDSSGGLDASFNASALASSEPGHDVKALAVQHPGAGDQIIVAGDFSITHNTTTYNGIARLTASGSLSDFPICHFDGASTPVGTIYPVADGSLLIGGIISGVELASDPNTLLPHSGVVRVDAADHLDSGFQTALPDDGPRAFAVQADGSILAGGVFQSVNNLPIKWLVRLNSDGTVGRQAWAPGWYLPIPVTNYTYTASAVASLELHVSDGEDCLNAGDHIDKLDDPSLLFNGVTWWQPDTVTPCRQPVDYGAFVDKQLWRGDSWQAGNVTPNGQSCLGLWDIKSKDISQVLIRSTDLRTNIVTESIDATQARDDIDVTHLVVALARLPLNCAPPLGGSPPAAVPLIGPPVIRNDSVTISRSLGVQTIDVLANDTSKDGGVLTVASVGAPGHGRAEIVLDASAVVYIANPGFFGTDSFAYTAKDRNGNIGTATVLVTVNTDPAPRRLACGQSFSSTLSSSSGFTTVRGGHQHADLYQIDAAKAKVLQISVSAPQFRSHLYLRDPLGRIIASAHAGKNADCTMNFGPLEMGGTYNIEVAGHDVYDGGVYSIVATVLHDFQGHSDCAPVGIPEFWADGIRVFPGDTVDFGVAASKTLTLTNAGTAPLVYDLGDTAPIDLSGAFNSVASQLPELPPNASLDFTLNVHNPAGSGQISGTLAFDFALPEFTFNPINLTAYINPSGTAPSVSISSPVANSVFFGPPSVSISATVSPGSAPVSEVEFFANGANGRIRLGQATAAPWTITWQNPPIGAYTIFARATDNASTPRKSDSSSVYVVIARAKPNAPPVAVHDEFIVPYSSLTTPPLTVLNVLANDYDPDGDPLTITAVSVAQGSASISPDKKSILYHPPQNAYGGDSFSYTISDGRHGTATATARITIIQTLVAISQPSDQQIYTDWTAAHHSSFDVTVNASATDGEISRIDLYVNDRLQNTVLAPDSLSGDHTYNWTAPSPGEYILKAVAFDSNGNHVASDPVKVFVQNGSIPPPVAKINTPADGQLIREGRVDCTGTANTADPNATGFSYTLKLILPGTGQVLKQITQSTPVTDSVLGQLDFTTLRNGSYILALDVMADGYLVSDQVNLTVESSLKIGNFTFSEQDLVIPVSGMPLQVTRTYNSLNPNPGDFGYGWNFAVNDADLQFADQRQDTSDISGSTFSLRTGGSRDVTLTLPDGRRTTFQFQFAQGGCLSANYMFCYRATWQAQPGINAQLTLANEADGELIAFPFGELYWQAAGEATAMDNYEFPSYILTTQDGTKYTFDREDLGFHNLASGSVAGTAAHAYGAARLTEIKTANQDRIVIGSGSSFYIDHYLAGSNTKDKSILIHREAHNRIDAIYDAKQLNLDGTLPANALPTVTYTYDANTNLSTVSRLVSTAGSGTYNTTTYKYENGDFPHFITQILDPRNVPAARTVYDPDGRMISVTDAAGNITQFDHDLSNNKETITDPLKNVTVHFYDERGNITTTIDPLNHMTSRTYDDNNNVITTTDANNYTTTNTYDPVTQQLASTTDPLGHTVQFAYNGFGQIAMSTDARGKVTSNGYDNNGNLTSTTQTLNPGQPDVHAITTQSGYDSSGRLTSTTDPLGTTSTYTYDSTTGNYVASVTVTTNDATTGNPVILSQTSTPADSYDANGNSLYSLTLIGSGITARTERTYDGQNRVTSSKRFFGPGTSDFLVSSTVYNPIGKAASTTDEYGRVTQYFYDAKGELTQTLYPDGTVTRTVYDALGRAFITTDRAVAPGTSDQSGPITVNVSRSIYDGAGRVFRTERVQGMVIGLVQSTTPTGIYTSSVVTDGTIYSTTKSDYDPAGRLMASTDAAGNTTSYGYDAAGRRVWVKDALGNLSTYTYDENGNQLTFTDANNNTVHYTYDDLNRCVATQYPDQVNLGQSAQHIITTTTYDDAGRRIAEMDANNVTTGFNYDGAGRLVAVTNAYRTTDQTITYYGYDQAGNKVSQTDANRHTTAFSYDLLGRQQGRTLPLGQSESVVYNNIGQVWKTIDFKGQITQFAYDAVGRVRTKFYFANQTANQNGMPGEARCYKYDPLGRLSQITERRGDNLDMTGCDNYTAMLGPVGGGGKGTPALASLRGAKHAHASGWSLSALRLAVARPAFLGTVTALALFGLALRLIPAPVRRMLIAFYLRGGWRVSATDPEVSILPRRRALRLPCYGLRLLSYVLVFVLFMEQLGIERLQNAVAQGTYANPTTDDSTRVTQLAYDADGHLTQVNSPEGVVNYGYDLTTGRHTSTYTAISPTPGVNSQIGYDYDELGRLKTVTQVVRNGAAYPGVYPNEVTTYGYDAVGNRASVQFPNGMVSAYTYNALNRLTGLTHKDASGNLLASYGYVLHPTGRRLSATEQVVQADNSTAAINVSWSYNNLYRLMGETSTSPTLGSAQHTSTYLYDNAGNRTQKTETAGSLIETINYTYDYNDRLLNEVSSVHGQTSYGYDDNGSETSKTGPNGNYTFTYNLQNKLASASITANGQTSTTGYLYNEQGIRVRTVSNGTVYNNYLIDQNNPSGYAQVIEELSSRGAVPTISYTIGDEVLAQCGGSSVATPSFLLADGHGSTRQLVAQGSSGLQIANQYNYDAYGNSLGALASPPQTSFLYCGQQYDSSLKQYNLRARFYDASNGRFSAMDTFMGNNEDPLSLHKYAYANLDPVNACDPRGLASVIEVLVVTSIIASLGALTGAAIFKATGGSALKGALLGIVAGGALSVAYYTGRLPAALAMGIIQGTLQVVIDQLFATYVMGEQTPGFALLQSFLAGFAMGSAAAAFDGAIPGPAWAALVSVFNDLLDNIGNKNPHGYKEIIVNAVVAALISTVPTVLSHITADAPTAATTKAAAVSKWIEQHPLDWQEFCYNSFGAFVGASVGFVIKEIFNVSL